MKKIVMAVAAVAMATSMFAADVAAQLLMNVNLFDSAKKTVLDDPKIVYDLNDTFYKFSVSGDKAGAAFLLAGTNENKDNKVEYSDEAKFQNVSLWFAPTDNLKITIGDIATGSLNRGTFAWWHRTVRVEKPSAITVNANVGGVALEFVNWGPLLDFNKDGYAMLGNFYLSGTYGLGDAGTIQVVAEKGADLSAYGVGGWEGGALTAVGVAYDHMPWQQTGFYADVFAAFTNDKFNFYKVASQIGGQYCADGLALRLTNMLAYGKKYGAADKFYYGFVTECSYAMDSLTPYVTVKGQDIMDKKAEVNAGIRTNVGICSIDASFHTAIASGADFAFDLPVVCKVSF